MSSRRVDERRCSGVDEFLDAYRRTFEAFDAPAIVDLFSFPLQLTSAADDVTVTTVPTREAWLPQVERLLHAYREIGVQAADVLGRQTIELTPKLVQAVVHWGIADADGRRIYEFDASYTLADLGDGLRITALAHNETPRLRTRMHDVRSDQPDEPAARRAC